MKRALILVDLQNDFFPGGALAVKDGDKVLPAINALMKMPFDLVVATKDYHPPLHVSFASTHGKQAGDIISDGETTQILWPNHCVQGSKGSDFAPGWDVVNVNQVVHKGTNVEIDSYSTFFDNGHSQETGLNQLLKEQGIDTIYIAGLATDYCVKYSVLDARDLGYKVFVVKEGCRPVNLRPEDGENAFQEMRESGASIISIKDLQERF